MTTRASRACAASQRRAARGWWCRSSAQSPWVGRDQFFKLLDFEAWAHLSLQFDRFMNIQFGWAKPFFRASAVSEHITRREYLYESFEIHVRDSLAELWECFRPQKSSISNLKKFTIWTKKLIIWTTLREWISRNWSISRASRCDEVIRDILKYLEKNRTSFFNC